MGGFGRSSGTAGPGGNGKGIKFSTSNKSQSCKICNTTVGTGDHQRVQIGDDNIFHLQCLQNKLIILKINLDLQNFANGNGIIPGKICSFLNDNFEAIVKEISKRKRTIDKLQAAESISNILLRCVIKKSPEFKSLRKESVRIKDIKNIFDFELYRKTTLNFREKLVQKFLFCIGEIEELEDLEKLVLA